MGPDVSPSMGGLFDLAARVEPPAGRGEPQVATAVATAALSAAARDRRRAVVLLVGADARDGSGVTPEAVREFLGRLAVPFHVWSVVSAPTLLARRFGPVTDVSSLPSFAAAVRALSRELALQRIVWVEGTHLPHRVELTGAVRGVALAR